MSICAAPGCDNVVAPRRVGRPAIYCCPACRPSHRRSAVVVEVAHPEASSDGRPADRVWAVRLRRADQVVVIADDLGWPSANALAQEVDQLLSPRPRRQGGGHRLEP